MKYTVVIRQPVSDDTRPVLEQQLVERFGLSPDQAQRLAARRSGRLMKPTGRARADLLLHVFQDVGAQVSLEEVRDETDIVSEPFQIVPPAPSVIRAVADPVDDVALASPAAALGDFRGFDSAPSAVLPSGGGLDAAPGTARAADTGVLTLPPQDAWADPFAAPMVIGAEPGGVLPMDSSPFGSAQAALDAPDPLSAPAPSAPTSTSAQAAPSADSWADFTGALTITDTKTQDETVSNPEAFLTSVPEESRAPAKRRGSLARQMTVGALLPLTLSTAVTLGLLSVILPRLQQQLVLQNAEAVAVAVGTSLDTRDQETVNAQLDTLLSRSQVGFVRVELPDGTTYFRSRNNQLDGTLQGRVATFLEKNPETGTFVNRGSAAEAYREQLAQLEAVGAGDSPQATELRELAEKPENRQSENTTYIVRRLGVADAGNGQRTTMRATEENSDMLYRISVGVPNSQAAANLRNTLLLVLGVSLLALGLAAVLAVRAARRVVQPIEQLVKVADAISMGDFSRPVQAGRNDEIGDLAQALERMRLSLSAAMERLRRRKRN